MIYGVEGQIKAIKVIGCVAFKQRMALSGEIKVIKTGWVSGLAEKNDLGFNALPAVTRPTNSH